jgi:acetyl/propionyl-CoA carboxylase alpha subunit
MREQLWQAALDLARGFNLENACTVEFLIDKAGSFYFTEIKARLQVEHPLTEMVTRKDLVREQIRIAAGERLGFEQSDVRLQGWAMQCRINAHDPWRHFLPSPGQLRRVHLPGGPDVRVDTYIFQGSDVPAIYDPLIAKLIAWGNDRPACLARMHRAIGELKLVGTATNLPLLQHLLHHPDFIAGVYSSDLRGDPYWRAPSPETHLSDLAVASAVLYLSRSQAFNPSTPERLNTGWHRSSRQVI